MQTKEINGIEYIVYEAGMILNDKDKSFYVENDLDYDGDVNCLHFYAIKNVIVGGNQYVRGDQDVGGNQNVGGNQYVRGNQNVRYIYLNLYCKYPIRIDRDSDNIKIGCHEKTSSEWTSFFDNEQKINMNPSDRNYKKLAIAFKAALVMRDMLKLMNDKK